MAVERPQSTVQTGAVMVETVAPFPEIILSSHPSKMGRLVSCYDVWMELSLI